MASSLRDLPRVDSLIADPRMSDHPRDLVRDAAREVLDEVRAEVLAGGALAADVGARVDDRVRAWLAPRLRRVINATGVVVHTNLGRAPWHPDAVAAVTAVAGGYSSLELDLATGKRGGRNRGIAEKLCRLTGAEHGIVVNNCAAAVLLALTSLANGREVIVSRGQLVEIGGSFRVPDVITAGGARLVEVGTTNRTRPADVAHAITSDTAVLLTVHPSNFRLEGFVRELRAEELVTLGRAHGVAVVADLGSGCLDERPGETRVRDCVQAGVDLVIFSGDKLLGGPQAGIVVGRREVVMRLRKHPMYRALRVCKGTAAALEATLAAHLRHDPPPVPAMLDMPAEVVADRCRTLVKALGAQGLSADVVAASGVAGGGAMPGQGLDSFAVRIPVPDAERAAEQLRHGPVPVIVRRRDGALWVDPRTVLAHDEADLIAMLSRLAGVTSDGLEDG